MRGDGGLDWLVAVKMEGSTWLGGYFGGQSGCQRSSECIWSSSTSSTSKCPDDSFEMSEIDYNIANRYLKSV